MIKATRSFFRTFLEDFVGSDNKFLAAVWCVAVVVILGFGFFLNSETVSILGIAESREFQVNFDTAVEIKQIHVIPGQVVKKGDLLLELGQKELDSQLRILRSRYDRLLAELKLRREIAYLTKDNSKMPEGADPLLVDLNDTKKEMSLLENRLRNLFVFAELDGAVGAVNFKNGEKAPAFAPLVTLVPVNPSYINGYVNENLHATVHVGQLVDVISASGQKIQGRVSSVGTRIVQIPDRVLRIQSLPAWGREVVVKIPSANGFLVGEKVSVKKSWGITLFSTAQAEQAGAAEDSFQSLEEINFPRRITELFQPEISGIVYIPDIHQFAMISDDYPEDRPAILLMNTKGEVAEQMLPIEGLERMEDIESISSDGDFLYLLSSLSATKKENLKDARQLFVKVRRNGIRFTLQKQVDLRKALLGALSRSQDKVLQAVFKQSQGTRLHDLEVEGHFVKNGDLYIALKRPLVFAGEGLILKLANAEKIFATGVLESRNVSVALRFPLSLPGKPTRLYLSDMISLEDHIYVSTSCVSEKCSAVWRINPETGASELIQEFNLKKLEGIAIGPSGHQIFGVFDNKKGGKFITIPFAATQGQK
ncbi:biotin/lipoyl-binding protein [Bdellovibrio sp. ArHS]|uniref:biotin/lipoyl-binding protein n=1 Tax=Bdellovibrio sp. ArHS TaxID=1569284 RepID=UPI000A449EC8|nr:biotin/lipoyl-binding protein [Bdellovibrio sp. ArHS]